MKGISSVTESREKFTVYSTPDCQRCRATARKLTDLNQPFDYIDVSLDPEAEQRSKSLGYTSAPVVVAPNGEHWSGFRPDLLQKHANARVPELALA